MNSSYFSRNKKAVEKELELLRIILTKCDELEQRIKKLELKIDQYEGF